jgi:hypothetical protein
VHEGIDAVIKGEIDMNNASTETSPANGANPRGDDKVKPDPVVHIGEGSYEGTHLYAEGIQNYLAEANVAKDAAEAAPDSKAEADDLMRAEAEAAARSRAPGK